MAPQFFKNIVGEGILLYYAKLTDVTKDYQIPITTLFRGKGRWLLKSA